MRSYVLLIRLPLKVLYMFKHIFGSTCWQIKADFNISIKDRALEGGHISFES